MKVETRSTVPVTAIEDAPSEVAIVGSKSMVDSSVKILPATGETISSGGVLFSKKFAMGHQRLGGTEASVVCQDLEAHEDINERIKLQ